MRTLVLLAAFAVVAPAGAQTSDGPSPWTTPDAPPCDALAAFRAADTQGRLAFTGDETYRTQYFATFGAVGLPIAPEDNPDILVDFMESGETFGASLTIRPSGLAIATTVEDWEAAALAFTGTIGQAMLACFGEDAAHAEAYISSSGPETRTAMQQVTGDAAVFVFVEPAEGGGLTMTTEITVGYE